MCKQRALLRCRPTGIFQVSRAEPITDVAGIARSRLCIDQKKLSNTPGCGQLGKYVLLVQTKSNIFLRPASGGDISRSRPAFLNTLILGHSGMPRPKKQCL